MYMMACAVWSEQSLSIVYMPYVNVLSDIRKNAVEKDDAGSGMRFKIWDLNSFILLWTVEGCEK